MPLPAELPLPPLPPPEDGTKLPVAAVPPVLGASTVWRSTVLRGAVAGASSSPAGAIPAVSSVTNVFRLFLPAPGFLRTAPSPSSTSPTSCESGTSATSAISSSSLPLCVVYGVSSSRFHCLRHSSSHLCDTMRCRPVWFALAHFAPSNS